jgi:methyl-accepting chemotaxis protein
MTDRQELADRLDFMGIDPEARASIRRLDPLIRREIGAALDSFYAKVRSVPETARHFSSDRHMSGAKSRQEQHWSSIAQAEFGDTYYREVRAVGETHARLGLEPRWYIGGYGLIAEHLLKAAIAQAWPRAGLQLVSASAGKAAGQDVANLVKAILLDMDLAISIYIDTLEAERRREEEVRREAEARQAHLVAALGDALSRLARGDVEHGLTAQVAPEFAKIKDDYNAAVATLRQALSATWAVRPCSTSPRARRARASPRAATRCAWWASASRRTSSSRRRSASRVSM